MPGKEGEGALFVEVQGPLPDGKRYLAVYPLSEDRTFSVEGREGEIRGEIKDGEVRVVFSPCKNKVCALSPPLRSEGEWIACVPGEVIIRIAASGPSASGRRRLDSVAY